MKTLSLSLGVLLMFLGFASSHSASVESRTDEESIKGAYKAYVKAWKTKDLAALKGLISPDYMAVNFEGTLSSKENELATAKSDLDWDTMTSTKSTRELGATPLSRRVHFRGGEKT